MVVWGEIMIQNNCQVRAAAAAATINAQSAIILIDNMSSMATWSSSGNCKEDQRRRDQVYMNCKKICQISILVMVHNAIVLKYF